MLFHEWKIFMKTKNDKFTAHLFIFAFVLGTIVWGGTNLGKILATAKNTGEVNIEKPFEPRNINVTLRSFSNNAPQNFVNSTAGKYSYKNRRAGKGGVEKHLVIKNLGKDEVHLSFDAYNYYLANGAETFHEGSAEGEARLRGNSITVNSITANLIADEGGGDKPSCPVGPTFARNRVTVKAAACAMNVSPEGVYTKSRINADLWD
jgi:hypothetical protein